MFNKKHAMLELASIPRDRAQLQQVIGEARSNQRRAHMMYIAAVMVFIVAFVVLVLWLHSHGSSVGSLPAGALEYVVYLPISIR